MAVKKRLRETPRAAAAYHVYAALGPTRTLKKLYLEMKNSPEWSEKVPTFRRIEEWSARHEWQERVKKYDEDWIAQKRAEKEALIEKTNEEDYDYGTKGLQIAYQQIERLIEAEKFGSQAAVQLVKIASDMRRMALNINNPEEKNPLAGGIQIIIETADPTPPAPQLPPARNIVDAD